MMNPRRFLTKPGSSLDRPELPQPWKVATETLVFRLGPWKLGSWSFESISNSTSPLAGESGASKMPPVVQPLTYQQMPDDGTISRAISFDRNAVRYVAYRGTRYFIDLLPGSFEDYLKKFSAKTRNTLKRKVRHFAQQCGGTLDFRTYRSPDEMIDFRRQALAVSLMSYQRKIGFGFPETEEFAADLVQRAANDGVCGFVLMNQSAPTAYVFCWIDGAAVIYSYCGYDPEYAQFSPGTVLLYLIIKWLFEQKNFTLFDLGNDGWDYKTMLATGAVKYLKVIWFPKTVSNLTWVILHWLVLRAWSGVALVKENAAAWVRKGKIGLTRADVHGILNRVTRRRAPNLSKPRPARQG
jgi:CelD/BcsL family acetyltransferase involved in cellulose biosynthesis